MSIKKRLVIDIGTNSVLALLAKVDSGKLSVIFDRKKTTRLGDGLISKGNLSPQAISRTIKAVADFYRDAECDEIYLLGTEALRLAKNSDNFRQAINDSTGHDLIIISGEKEAELSFLGSVYGLDLGEEDIILADVGGGSSEIVAGVGLEVKGSVSIAIGALTLREISDFDSLDTYVGRAESIIRDNIGRIPYVPSAKLVATGGTIVSAAAIRMGSGQFSAGLIHGALLTIEDIRAIAARFEVALTSERKSIIPFDPDRADIMLPGLGIFLAIMGIMEKYEVVVSTGGLRYGAILYPDKISA